MRKMSPTVAAWSFLAPLGLAVVVAVAVLCDAAARDPLLSPYSRTAALVAATKGTTNGGGRGALLFARSGGRSGLAAVREGMNEQFETVREVQFRRYSVPRFDPSMQDSVPEESVLLDCLEIAHRSPTGFNAQPYKVVVVRDAAARKELSKAMLGKNGERVCDAGAVVVFLSDLNCMRDVGRLRELHKAEGRPSGYLGPLGGAYLAVFSSGHVWPLRLPMLLVKRLAFGILSRMGFHLPSPESAECWAVKNTMLVASSFITAATAAGLGTAPMEGYDARRVRKCLGIPRRYRIPLCVCVGVPMARKENGRSETGKSLRYPSAEVFFSEKYGDAMKSHI